MRVVVAGATGLVGSRTVVRLRDHGVEVVPLSHRDHSDAAAERDLARALRGADILVDVTDAPSPAEPLSLQFFRTSTTALLAAAERAGAERTTSPRRSRTWRWGSRCSAPWRSPGRRSSGSTS
ncbi:NAD-dependent epimerase/dehydratase family protein [Actinacidiphila glaucinigra]|uniref:NAD-dependent epimerase/dehydratase family protein n=1 Tax=Actinacidiphila glaucinigra TaxID=235986 RepID=UPI003824F27B